VTLKGRYEALCDVSVLGAFMRLKDAVIQSDLQCNEGLCS